MTRPFALACALLLAASALGADETRHTVLMMERPAGAQVTRVRENGEREITFEFNDRGRGPKLNSRIRLSETGLPVFVETAGVDYLKAPVEERFAIDDGRAQWRNTAEAGHKQLEAPAFYLSLQGIPEELGLLARALLAAPGGRLDLLPEGAATITSGATLVVAGAPGSKRVRAHEVSGLGFTPTTVWLDEDNEYFATVSSWSSYVLEGYEDSVPKLLAYQDERESRRTAETARALTRTPTRPLAIVDANVFDSLTGDAQPNFTVVLEDARIVAVGPTRTTPIPDDAERIDARGRTLLPGLWDMHVHMGPNDGVLHIAAGVTSVRDLANENESLQKIKASIEAGREIGPRIIARGFMDGRGPYAGPTKVFVDSEDEGRAAIERYAQQGYEGIKIYSSVQPQLAPALIRMAHERGLKVSGHVPAFMTAEQLVRAGIDELQHINFVFLNFFEDVQDTRTPARFTSVAERAATLDLDSSRVRAFARLLKQRNVVVDPTVAIFESMFTDRPGVIPVGFSDIAARLPPQVRRSLLVGGLPVTPENDQRYRQSAQALLRMVKLLYDEGVTLVPGTDSLPGFTLHRELELYAAAGIPAPQVLRIATSGAARVAGRQQELGVIAPGKLADLVLVEGDPTQRISDIRRTSLVIKNGLVFAPAALYRSMGVAP